MSEALDQSVMVVEDDSVEMIVSRVAYELMSGKSAITIDSSSECQEKLSDDSKE